MNILESSAYQLYKQGKLTKAFYDAYAKESSIVSIAMASGIAGIAFVNPVLGLCVLGVATGLGIIDEYQIDKHLRKQFGDFLALEDIELVSKGKVILKGNREIIIDDNQYLALKELAQISGTHRVD